MAGAADQRQAPLPLGEIQKGRRLRQQFPRPTLTYPTSEQAKLKKKNPLTELCSGSGARTALDPPPATTAFFSASDSSPAQRAAAGGGARRQRRRRRRKQRRGGRPRPLRLDRQRGRARKPRPVTAPTNTLKGLLRGNIHISNRNLRSGLTSMVGTWQKKGKKYFDCHYTLVLPGAQGYFSDWRRRGRTELHSFPPHAPVWALLLSLQHCDSQALEGSAFCGSGWERRAGLWERERGVENWGPGWRSSAFRNYNSNNQNGGFKSLS